MRHPALWTLFLVACGSPTVFPPDTDDTDTDLPVDTDVEPPDTDTDLPGTDADGDGWTVEEGDCDDSTIWANPAWDEQANDDIDNDCDGRIDEVFAGVIALNLSSESGQDQLLFIDSLGELDDTLVLDAGVAGAVQLAPAIGGDGWITAEPLLPGLIAIDADGGVSAIWTDETEYPEGTEPPGLFSAAVHPDGYYLVNGADRLWQVTPEGVATVVAEWDCVEPPEGATEICPLDLSINSAGVVGLFGYFGGFATWTLEGGLDIRVPDNIEDTTQQWVASELRNDEFVALGYDGDRTVIVRWDEAGDTFDEVGEWTNADYTPRDFTVEEETGDFYISANGAWFTTVWRMTADGTYMAPFYPGSDELIYDPDDPPEAHRDMLGVLPRYSED